jgi:AbrB family looped-hinge helix DNA binding protein
MSLVTVKQKYQVTLPQKVREELGISEGDLLEAAVLNGKIVLSPKTVVDRHPDVDRHPEIDAALAEALEEVAAGRVSPSFSSVKELKDYLETKKPV